MTSTTPVRDAAEHNAFFPSEYSLGQYVPPTTDFDGAAGAPQVTTGPTKVLTLLTDERYLALEDGSYFSTGNHPVETLLPLMHLEAAGYEIEAATLSGNLAKFELWATPAEDEALTAAWDRLRPRFESPKKLSDVVDALATDSDYAAVFIPGGHGATIGLPDSPVVGRLLEWALREGRHIITLCHGPAALLAATGAEGDNLFAGYSTVVFPDALDTGANLEIGYLPGAMKWLVAEELTKRGVTVLNDDMTGRVHQDRTLITGDSPLASNALGRLAVEALTGGTYSEQ